MSDRLRLEDLSPYHQQQYREQMAIEDAKARRLGRRLALANPPEKPDSSNHSITSNSSPKPKKPKRADKFDSEWEARYDKHLASLYAAGEIRRYFFHGLKLGDPASWYTPDFWIVGKDGRNIIHEVKAHWRSRDRRIWNQVRLKYAEEFEFGIVRYERGSLVIYDDWTGPAKPAP